MERRCKLREERIRIHIMENSKETKTYHDKRPQFRNKGPSKLRQQFGKGMTAFLVVAASIVFYFAFLRFNGISNIFEKIFQILKPIISVSYTHLYCNVSILRSSLEITFSQSH